MSQAITLIPVKKIKSQGSKKSLVDSVLVLLHDSISKAGLFNPIGVRPDPKSHDKHAIIHACKLYRVVAKMMKEDVIEALIFENMSDEEAELAALSENVCRTHAKPADLLLHLRKWQDVYRNHFPHLEGRKLSGTSRWADSMKAEAK